MGVQRAVFPDVEMLIAFCMVKVHVSLHVSGLGGFALQ
jgi:hypothetical protein